MAGEDCSAEDAVATVEVIDEEGDAIVEELDVSA